MRLPHRFRNRWVYAGVTAISALAFLSIWGGGLDLDSSTSSLTYGLALSVGIAALLLWPNKKRPKRRMALSGVLIVVIGFLTIIPSTMFFDGLKDGELGEAYFWREFIDIVPIGGFALLLFGSLMTLGLPYAVAVLMSFVFADDPIASDDPF